MSSKLREAQAGSDETCSLDMSPMIDMVFLLLMFFLVNATLVVVKLDKEVTVPVAEHSRKPEDGKGRIVVNIYKDGEFRTERSEILADEEAIFQLVKTEKEANDMKGYKTKLHLRGDRDTVFKYSRKVIRTAARAGVDQVVFAVYVTEK